MLRTTDAQKKRAPFLRQIRHKHLLLLTVLCLSLALFGTAKAAEFAEGEVYRLKAGETVSDDLYVFAREIIIDGTVEGDVIAFGGIVEINGVVTGDLLAGGAGITINGEVQDDVRAAGAGITVAGVVGDDVIVAGGGGLPGMPINIGNRSVTTGIRLTQDGSIGGDMIVAGDRGAIAGQIADDLLAGMNNLAFNAVVGGDVQIYAQTLTIGSAAEVGGTLRYSTASEGTVPDGVAATVVAVPWQAAETAQAQPAPTNLTRQFGWWLVRTLLIALGLALVGWLMLAFASPLVERPAAALAAKPAEAGIFGAIAAALTIPIAAALIVLGAIFWGLFPGAVAMFAALFGALSLFWLFSPLITGLWLGRKFLAAINRDTGTLAAMLIGGLTIAVVGRMLALIPCAGEVAYRLLYLLSFAFALGGGLLARFSPPEAAAQDEAPAQIEDQSV